jgi:prepilin-type processing-associated H-X9-DG protein
MEMPRRCLDQMARPDRLGWSARGFKLVHVLAIVGAMGLAVGLIIPAVAHSRERARSTLCRSNLAVLGPALRLYALDFGNVLPYEDRGEEKTAGRTCWFDAINPYLTKAGADPNVKICPTVGLGSPNAEEGYKMNSKLAPSPPKPGGPGQKQPPPPSNTEPPKPYRKLDTLPRPQATVVLFDGDVGGKGASFKGRWREKGDDVNYRHNNSTNILFADWHTEEMSKGTLKKRSVHNTPVIWQPADSGVWDPMEQKAKKSK